jgi:hypothetical protein
MTERVTPVVFCIDVEPFGRQVDEAADWRGVDETASDLERWRGELAAATGRPARFAWFWRADPQIAITYGDAAWGFRRYRDLYAATCSRGDAHGIHPHMWRRLPEGVGWIQDRADARWVDHCIDVSLATFRAATGSRCSMTRLGDRALDPVAYRCLRQHRVRVDLSVEPGAAPFDQESTAASPDFSRAPTRPYHPRRNDVARPRRFGSGPVLLPLSAIAARGPTGGGHCTVYPWMPDAAAQVCRLLDARAPYLAFAIRSDITLRSELAPSFETFRRSFLDHPRASSISFVTPLEALDALRRGGAVRNPALV